MSEAALIDPATDDATRADLAALRQLSVDEHLAAIRSALRVSIDHIRIAARHLAILAEQGKDVDWLIANRSLTDLEIGFLRGLRLIGAGLMLPDVLLYYLQKPHVAQLVGGLPVDVQERLVKEGIGLPLRELTPDGTPTERLVNPGRLNRELLGQLFDEEGHLRTVAEQDVFLAGLRSKEARRRAAGLEDVRIGKWKVDREKRGAWLNGRFYAESEFRAIIRALDA